MGNIKTSSTDTLNCPRGENNCPIFEQIQALRDQVEYLTKQVRTDYLTGLYNYRHLFFSLEQEIERSLRNRLPTTLIMLDVDHFKSFNDDYGHIAGDEVLKHLATLIKSHIRKLDIPCRYGGEEFSIILPSTPLMIGVQVAERLRASVEAAEIIWKDTRLNITISLGVDVYLANSNDTATHFIERADNQLYQAKQSGRNCVAYREEKRNEIRVTADEKAALFDQLDNKNK